MESLLKSSLRRLMAWRFPGSATYWERRYAAGGNSGSGSYGRLAEFKSRILNDFVANRGIETVIEFGCGDGNQLACFKFPSYLGVDVADTALELCRRKYAADPTKQFLALRDLGEQKAELTMSLDVVYHLVEDHVFDSYMRQLFASAGEYVAIYSSDCNADAGAAHVRHRNIRDWVEKNIPDWVLLDIVRNPYPLVDDPVNESFADFFFYRKQTDAQL